MDGACDHAASSSPSLPTTATSPLPSFNTSPPLGSAAEIRHQQVSPSRQQRLLNARNIRFPAKKLSLSGLSNKLTEVINSTELIDDSVQLSRNQENRLPRSESTGTINRRIGLGILEEISNTARVRSSRRSPDISIYQDNAKDSSSSIVPVPDSLSCIDLHSNSTSLIPFDDFQNSLDNMRLRQISNNHVLLSDMNSPPSFRSKHKNRPSQHQFDADEYIEHIEKELQQVRDEAYSPLTRRPMKEKLKAANKENERLQKELTQLKEKFETEVKRTVEHKTKTEVELKRKVRDLEDTLEEKDNTIRQLQSRHEEKRLDTNIVETLKATIDRLEEEKSDLESINVGMSKRNEVLTQLLAMSPTKAFHDRNPSSPSREKRNARPISLILPRPQPSSKQVSQIDSLACSPHSLNSADISPLKLSPDSDFQSTSSNEGGMHNNDLQQPDLDQASRALRSPFLHQTQSRRWTVLSDVSASSSTCTEEPKPQYRRKPRKFIAGSTQLKPLLLPALAGESIPSASTTSSPRSWLQNDGSESDLDDTILAHEVEDEPLSAKDLVVRHHSSVLSEWSPTGVTDGPGPACHSGGLDLPNKAQSPGRHQLPASYSCEATDASRPCKITECGLIRLETDSKQPARRSDRNVYPKEHMQLDSSSFQSMPMPTTPDSLAVIPRPLFSPAHQNFEKPTQLTEENLLSVSPASWLSSPVNLRKRYRATLPGSDEASSDFRDPHHQRARSLAPSTPPRSLSPHHHTRSKSSIENQQLFEQLKTVRSSNNFVEIFRQKNFAVKPLAAVTIRTIYKILSTCTSVVRDAQRDPFSLARRVLANAWRMNWKILGKLSWWVLGLFVQPRPVPKVRPAIDWDHYDGESIASRHCIWEPDGQSTDDDPEIWYAKDRLDTGCTVSQGANPTPPPTSSNLSSPTDEKPGWARSLFLWGKFSTALMLAVSGAVVKGPGEMLRDTQGNLDLDASKPILSEVRNSPANDSPVVSSQRSGKQGPQGQRELARDYNKEERRGTTFHNYSPLAGLETSFQLRNSSLMGQIQESHCEINTRLDQTEWKPLSEPVPAAQAQCISK